MYMIQILIFDFEKYQKLRLIEYCSRCGIEVDKTLSMQENWKYFF